MASHSVLRQVPFFLCYGATFYAIFLPKHKSDWRHLCKHLCSPISAQTGRLASNLLLQGSSNKQVEAPFLCFLFAPHLLLLLYENPHWQVSRKLYILFLLHGGGGGIDYEYHCFTATDSRRCPAMPLLPDQRWCVAPYDIALLSVDSASLISEAGGDIWRDALRFTIIHKSQAIKAKSIEVWV